MRQELTDILGNRARFDIRLDRLTTWGVGGPVQYFCRVHNADEAKALIAIAQKQNIPWMPLGRGSNLLVKDSGYKGLMLRLSGPLAAVSVEETRLMAGGGASLGVVLRSCVKNSLSGLEWSCGIPGTIGGAVVQNAGAHGCEMSEIIEDITVLLPDGKEKTFKNSELPATYRHRNLPFKSMVLNVTLNLHKEDSDLIKLRIKRLMQRRLGSQPLNSKTAGSVFKNPPGDFAGRLIEEAGCKGMVIGDAMVSLCHANFIENRGRATANDILLLIDEVGKRVRAKTGVRLEPEVEVVGLA